MTTLITEYNRMAVTLQEAKDVPEKDDTALRLIKLQSDHLEITSNLQFAHDVVRRHANLRRASNPLYKSVLLYLPRNKIFAADVLSRYIIAVKSGADLLAIGRITTNLINKAVEKRNYVTSSKIENFITVEYDALLDSLIAIGFLDWHWVKDYELNSDSVMEAC